MGGLVRDIGVCGEDSFQGFRSFRQRTVLGKFQGGFDFFFHPLADLMEVGFIPITRLNEQALCCQNRISFFPFFKELWGTYLAGSCSEWPCMRMVLNSKKVGPSPARAFAIPRLAAR